MKMTRRPAIPPPPDIIHIELTMDEAAGLKNYLTHAYIPDRIYPFLAVFKQHLLTVLER